MLLREILMSSNIKSCLERDASQIPGSVEFLGFKIKSGLESQKIKKSIQSLFRENELKTTIQCNLKIVDYLNLTFKLTGSLYIYIYSNIRPKWKQNRKFQNENCFFLVNVTQNAKLGRTRTKRDTRMHVHTHTHTHTHTHIHTFTNRQTAISL